MRRGWFELLAGSQNLRLFIKTASAALLGCLALLSGPVLANSSANANADITQPLRQTQGGALTGDEKFQQLFASWEALDRSGPQGSTLRPSVSIPSRLPLDGPALTSGFGMRTHPVLGGRRQHKGRSEEHTSELQSLMRISYAVFCLKKKTRTKYTIHTSHRYR